MKLVEECRGTGSVSWHGQTFSPVPYRISRYQGMTPAGLPIPGLHRIEGQLALPAGAAAAGRVGHNMTLALEDGRSLALTLADADGRVLAEGHGPGRGCSCC
jgi:hypothetical protein